jgi:tetratricopeptide (TPR) repeat protein
VADAIGLAEADVARALSGELSQHYQLVTATRVDRIGAQRLLRYRFRHVLFETYLYQRLDAVTRTRLHEAIGAALEKRYADQPDELSEIALQLARQFEAAGLNLKAIHYGLIAAQRAARLSAYREASRLLTHSLTLLAAVPDSLERVHLETNVQLALGAVLLEQGWGTADRARAFDRALELAQQTGTLTELLVSLYSLADLAQSRGEAAKTVTLSHELLRLAEQTGQASLLALAHYSMGSGQFTIGNLSQARAQWKQAVALHDQAAELKGVLRTGVDIDISALSWSIWATWMMGDSMAAAAQVEQVLARAHEIDHAFSLGIALMVGVCPYWLWQGRPADAQARQYIDQLSRLAEGGVPMFRAWVKVFDGYWRARRGEVTGLAELRQGMDEWAVTGSRSGYAYQRLLLIEAYLIAGEIAAAQQAADEALAFIEQSGNRALEAELHRLRGEIAAARGDLAEAGACFQRALEVARAQGAVTWEQRVTQSLEQLRP